VLAYQQVRITSSVSCGSLSILQTLKGGEEMPDETMRACMEVEQRMAVSMEEFMAYRTYLEAPLDGRTPEGIIHAFSLFLTSQTAEGLAGLQKSAEGRAPDDLLFEKLANSSNFTFLPPGMIADIPCDPPVKPSAVMMGVFRSIHIATAGPLAGLLATLPLVIFLVFWYAIIGIIASQIGLFVLFIPHTYVGLLFYPIIKALWTPPAQAAYQRVAAKYENAPKAVAEGCPQGLLKLGSSTPQCIGPMKHGDALRIACPGGGSGSAVVTCESKYNGAPVIRDNYCPA